MPMTDWELLQAYAHQRSEQAFATLMQRHLALVYSAALRQVVDPALAEDISQAVFVLLARKAGSLPPSAVLCGWLFRTTRFVARAAMRTEQRYRRRQQEAVAMQMQEGTEVGWEKIAPVLDEAVMRLPEMDRTAVLLRYFERKSFQDVGLDLGITEEAAKKRVARALDRLRGFFHRHHQVSSAMVLGSALETHSVKAAPSGLAKRIEAAKAAGASALPASLAQLIELAARKLWWSRVRTNFALGGAVAGILILGYFALQAVQKTSRVAPHDIVAAHGSPNAPTNVRPTAVGLRTLANQGPALLTLRVVSAADNRPASGADVLAYYWNFPEATAPSVRLHTDGTGACQVPVASQRFETLRVWISAPGYVPEVIDWHQYEIASLDTLYTVRLQRGLTVSGVVRNGSGKTVAGVRLQIGSPGVNLAQRENIGYHPDLSSFTSGERGRWQCDQVSPNADNLTLFLTHPDFARKRVYLPIHGQEATNAVLVMSVGVPLTGSVLTTNNVPILDAKVEEIDPYGGPSLSAQTDETGQFVFAHVNPGVMKLQVQARNYASVTKNITVERSMSPVQFVLSDWAPAGRRATSAGEIHLVGNVVDAKTGLPIPRFTVVMDELRGGHPTFVGDGKDGRFDWMHACRFFHEFSLEVDAPGYQPVASEVVEVSPQEHHFEFQLQRSTGVDGQVLLADGGPAAGVQVFLWGKRPHSHGYFGPVIMKTALKQTKIMPNDPSDRNSMTTTTDDHGKFHFAPKLGIEGIVTAGQSGCAAVTLNALASGPIHLHAWGRIEGVLLSGHKPLSGQTVSIRPALAPNPQPAVPVEGDAKTDDAGRFVFERVPPGTVTLAMVTSYHGDGPGVIGLSQDTTVTVLPGGTCQATIGGSGRSVIGRIVSQPSGQPMDWRFNLPVLIRQVPGLVKPDRKDYPDEFALRRAWAAYDQAQAKYYLRIGSDGSFEIDDVPAGNYELVLRPAEPPREPLTGDDFLNRHPRELGSLTKDVVVPEASSDQTDDPFDLGTVSVPVHLTEKTMLPNSRPSP
ncbi:MAG: sigma-70 family RNA polymerase sigma factor [Verrucomicrobia bacterium]|nr:sigma-70 family RNA polymerase sigma factor [Verrucomicrobiota bacterium]